MIVKVTFSDPFDSDVIVYDNCSTITENKDYYTIIVKDKYTRIYNAVRRISKKFVKSIEIK